MKKHRIDFLSVDAAGFNQLRDQWRSAAAGCALSAAGLRVASILPTFVSREHGYAFPENEHLAEALGMSPETAKRGVKALDDAGLIERETMVKRDDRDEAIGRLRRIYLTMPEVKGQKVKGQPEVKGQKRLGEGSYGWPNIPDRITPDKKTGRDERKLGAYVPAREAAPSPYSNDVAFLDTFDRIVMEMTDGQKIGAGAFDGIVQEAFNQTTDSDRDQYMPFHWSDVCALRSSEAAEWFRHRAGQIVYRKVAA